MLGSRFAHDPWISSHLLQPLCRSVNVLRRCRIFPTQPAFQAKAQRKLPRASEMFARKLANLTKIILKTLGQPSVSFALLKIFFFQLIIEDPWEAGKESMLSLNFRPPFTTVPKMQTALTKKFLQLSFQANSEDTCFSVKNPQVSCENSSQTTLRLVNSPNEILVSDFPNLIGVYL